MTVGTSLRNRVRRLEELGDAQDGVIVKIFYAASQEEHDELERAWLEQNRASLERNTEGMLYLVHLPPRGSTP